MDVLSFGFCIEIMKYLKCFSTVGTVELSEIVCLFYIIESMNECPHLIGYHTHVPSEGASTASFRIK